MNWDKVRNEDKFSRSARSMHNFQDGTKVKKKITGFAAKFPGTCITCKEAIKPGHMILLFAKGKPYHVKCVK